MPRRYKLLTNEGSLGSRVEITKLSRLVLAIEAARNLSLGFVMIFIPVVFEVSIYNAVDDYVPIWVFGVAFLLTGLYCIFAVWKTSVILTRHAFQTSAIVTTFWTSAFIAALLFGNPASLRVIIPFATLFAIDSVFIASSVTKKG